MFETGILGREIIAALGKESSKWKTVYALSRSQKQQCPSNVKHSHIDLTGDTKQMAEELKGIEAEIVFFSAYLQKDSEEENWEVNGTAVCVESMMLSLTSVSLRGDARQLS